MKTLTHFCASTAWALIMGATCFAQRHTQTNLVSNTAGVAPVTDPQLINPVSMEPRRNAMARTG
jgi:hypothetical protein